MAPKNLLEARLVQLRDGRWTKAYARLVLDAVERSGDSVSAFARLHGLSAKKIFWWRSQLENDDPPADSEHNFVPVALTRKNFLFAGSYAGAERAAVVYTILRCCRLAGVDPVEYLTEVLPVLARKIKRVDVAQLMPAAWARSRAA
ncbi:IS66 family insertion sequence element accessory protein TnpA [Enhygromyxa salina]|nr:hypothetical protein [Enhygromyxa salina]